MNACYLIKNGAKNFKYNTSLTEHQNSQLMVEALMILTLLVEHDAVKTLGGIINVEQVHKANQIFLDDQVSEIS